jgi:hypothetical protein
MKNASRALLTLALSCGAVFGQAVSFGVTAGLPTLDRASPSDESRLYIVGPTAEFQLPRAFAIEVDALYQRVGNSFVAGLIPGGSSVGNSVVGGVIPGGASGAQLFNFADRSRGNEWEFPALGKYYFHTRTAGQPFVGAGFVERWLSQTEDSTQANNLGGPLQATTFTFHSSQLSTGLTSTVGIRLRTGPLQWQPQFRYNRWGSLGALTQKNEADLVLGIHF